MLDKNTLVKITNRYDGRVGYSIPDLGNLHRGFAPNETKEVTMDMTVTDTKPTEKELIDMDFGWKIVKHVKSNAIVIVKDGVTLGVGAGQMNRVGSAKIAIDEAHAKGVTEGLVLASDGFLPFGDTVEYASQNGVVAIVQPGGSIRDEESIETANKNEMSMLFTGMRHFKH